MMALSVGFLPEVVEFKHFYITPQVMVQMVLIIVLLLIQVWVLKQQPQQVVLYILNIPIQ
ncbi:MAG: hypothetical protein CL557_17840 [Alphaproteobacteria bacterium]|nr:hypothetical protein [Alphaproteobacteria bacterium]